VPERMAFYRFEELSSLHEVFDFGDIE